LHRGTRIVRSAPGTSIQVKKNYSEVSAMAQPRVRAYVINLLRRPERKADMTPGCCTLEAAGVPVEFLEATDGRDLEGDKLTNFEGTLFHPWKCEDSPNRFHNRLLRAGEIACGMSHVRVWRAAADNQLDLTLVLEDDARFGPTLWADLQRELKSLEAMGLEWDLLYLGRSPPREDHCDVSQYARDGERVTPNLVVPGFSYCTFGYALSPRGVQRILAAGYEQAIMPLDEFIPALYTQHPRADVRLKLQDKERLVALAWCDEQGRGLVTQMEVGHVAVVGSDTEDSACIDMLPDGTLIRVKERDSVRDEISLIRSAPCTRALA